MGLYQPQLFRRNSEAGDYNLIKPLIRGEKHVNNTIILNQKGLFGCVYMYLYNVWIYYV